LQLLGRNFSLRFSWPQGHLPESQKAPIGESGLLGLAIRSGYSRRLPGSGPTADIRRLPWTNKRRKR